MHSYQNVLQYTPPTYLSSLHDLECLTYLTYLEHFGDHFGRLNVRPIWLVAPRGCLSYLMSNDVLRCLVDDLDFLHVATTICPIWFFTFFAHRVNLRLPDLVIIDYDKLQCITGRGRSIEYLGYLLNNRLRYRAYLHIKAFFEQTHFDIF